MRKLSSALLEPLPLLATVLRQGLAAFPSTFAVPAGHANLAAAHAPAELAGTYTLTVPLQSRHGVAASKSASTVPAAQLYWLHMRLEPGGT